MSAGPENNFIAAVHKHLPPEDMLHREGMHNQYRGGTADVWYSAESDLWVEYKWVDLPKKDDTLVDITTPRGKKQESPLSMLQQQWLRRRLDEGRNVAVIVGFRTGPRDSFGLILQHGDWEEPRTARFYREWSKPTKDVAAWLKQQVGEFAHAEFRPRSSGTVRKHEGGHDRLPVRINRDAARVHGQTIISTQATRSRRTKR